MSNLDEWIEGVLIVAEANGMPDSEVIPTWPRDLVEANPGLYPDLTVGDVRQWQAARATDSIKVVRQCVCGHEWNSAEDNCPACVGDAYNEGYDDARTSCQQCIAEYQNGLSMGLTIARAKLLEATSLEDADRILAECVALERGEA